MLISSKYPLGIGLLHLYERNNEPIENPKEIVHIIGNGRASYYFSNNLNKKKYIPIVISPNELTLNTTKLIDSIDNPNTSIYLNKINFIHIKDKVKKVDMDKKLIITENNKNIKYKNLVLAIGLESNDYNIRGVNEYALKIKNPEDIKELRIKFNGFTNTELYNNLSKISQIKPTGIIVNDDFSIGSKSNIYCLGDMVSNKGPKTTLNTINQGKWLAYYFNNDKNYEKTGEYKIKDLGKVIYTNDSIYIENKYYTGYIKKYLDIIIDFIYKR